MKYRLSLDLGTNSLGWSMYEVDSEKNPVSVIDSGVRIFTDSRDPQSGQSLATERREKRGARRNRDRFLIRKKELINVLEKYGFFPSDTEEQKDLEKLCPYRLRAKAVYEKLDIYELGRAIFHLNQSRGFKSNRKTDNKDSESGAMKKSISEFKQLIHDNKARTAGEMLYRLKKRKKSVKARLHGSGKDAKYDIYCDRSMIEHEFDYIWRQQQKFGCENMSDEAYNAIKYVIFYQRPLRPVKPGKCSCLNSEDRAPKALPISQRFRILQTITDLRIISFEHTSEPLSPKQQDTLYNMLSTKGSVSFNSLKTKFDLDSTYRFSHETDKNSKLEGDKTAFVLRKKENFGKDWDNLSFEEQTEIVHMLLEEEDEEKLINTLVEKWHLSQDNAENVANAFLVDGHMSYCETVLNQLSESMADHKTLTESLSENGYDNLNPNLDGSMEYLPYYGTVLEKYIGTGTGLEEDNEEVRYGKISNPTVHRGLKQLQKTVNMIIRKYGKPYQIVVELGRELKMSRKQKMEVLKNQRNNEKTNERYKDILEELGHRNNRENRDRLRLWEELSESPVSRCCIYSGQPISKEQLFGPQIEIEHILPFSKTFDNSLANKTVSYRHMNKIKKNQSPYQAFSKNDNWPDIVARSNSLPLNKKWRFSEDAMERFIEDNKFLDRQLTDTQYYSKVARQYLTAVCPDIWSVSGKMTSLIRRWSGLNGILSSDKNKNRNDHRHHAVDALAIGLIDRSRLQKISELSGKNELENTDKILSKDMSVEPWDGFYQDVEKSVNKIVVSHKQEHGKNAKLHDETAYGLLEEDGKKYLVTKKIISEMSPKELENIISSSVKNKVDDALIGIDRKNKNERERALKEFSEKTGIYKARYKKDQDNYIVIKHKNGERYKAYIEGSYHHVDVYQTEDGKMHGEPMTYMNLDNNRPAKWKTIKPKPKLFLRIHKKDILKINEDGMDRYYTVLKLSPAAKTIFIAETNIAGKLSDILSDTTLYKQMSYKQLKEKNVVKVSVNEIGEITELGY